MSELFCTQPDSESLFCWGCVKMASTAHIARSGTLEPLNPEPLNPEPGHFELLDFQTY